MSLDGPRERPADEAWGYDAAGETGMLPINHPNSSWTTAADLLARKEYDGRQPGTKNYKQVDDWTRDIPDDRNIESDYLGDTQTSDFESHDDVQSLWDTDDAVVFDALYNGGGHV